MALIEWNDNLSLGLELIDSQHKVLIKIINDLNEAMKQGKGSEIMGTILREMLDYTVFHFGEEEKLFKKFGYAEEPAHVREHKAFISKIEEYKEGLAAKKLSLSITVMNFLKDWLKDHIMVKDPKYVPLFKANGIK